jgi:hypothetical protein
MTDDMMALSGLMQKSADADVRREMKLSPVTLVHSHTRGMRCSATRGYTKCKPRRIVCFGASPSSPRPHQWEQGVVHRGAWRQLGFQAWEGG